MCNLSINFYKICCYRTKILESELAKYRSKVISLEEDLNKALQNNGIIYSFLSDMYNVYITDQV